MKVAKGNHYRTALMNGQCKKNLSQSCQIKTGPDEISDSWKLQSLVSLSNQNLRYDNVYDYGLEMGNLFPR